LPRADFRSKDETLDRLALVKLLAVMCYPSDPRSREGMLRQARATITLARHQPAPVREADRWSAALWSEFAQHSSTACLAGAFYLALAQLSALGRPGELVTALSLAADLAGDWAPQRSESDLIVAYDSYRSVSHLWAVIVFGRFQGRDELSPPSFQTIPDFLVYAAEIARLAMALDWAVPVEDETPRTGMLPAGSLAAVALDADSLWTFVLPSALVHRVDVEIFPMSPRAGWRQSQQAGSLHLGG
jgi:hypothetical protein